MARRRNRPLLHRIPLPHLQKISTDDRFRHLLDPTPRIQRPLQSPMRPMLLRRRMDPGLHQKLNAHWRYRQVLLKRYEPPSADHQARTGLDLKAGNYRMAQPQQVSPPHNENSRILQRQPNLHLQRDLEFRSEDQVRAERILPLQRPQRILLVRRP